MLIQRLTLRWILTLVLALDADTGAGTAGGGGGGEMVVLVVVAVVMDVDPRRCRYTMASQHLATQDRYHSVQQPVSARHASDAMRVRNLANGGGRRGGISGCGGYAHQPNGRMKRRNRKRTKDTDNLLSRW
jgi:hypothetical protein